MGLFNKTVTTVGTSFSQLMDQEIDPIVQSIMYSTLEERPVGEDLTDTVVNGYGPKALQYYRYGLDHYYLGLPSGKVVDTSVNVTMIENAIRTETGRNVRVVSWRGEETLDTYYYYAKYFFLDSQLNDIGDIQDWGYDVADGTHPTLRAPTESDFQSPYFPIVPVRLDNQDLMDPARAGSDQYDTSKTLLWKLNIDIDDLREAINGSDNIEDMDNIFVHLGANIQSDNPYTMRYLHEYFKACFTTQTCTEADWARWEKGDKVSPPKGNIFKIGEGQYRRDFGCNYITYNIKAGNIGEVGTVTRTNNLGGYTSYPSYSIGQSAMIMRYQLTETRYEETVVYGPMMINYVYHSHTVDTDLADSLDEEKNDFILPLDLNTCRSLSSTFLMYTVQDCCMIVVNSVQKDKVGLFKRLFSKTWFRILLAVVALCYGAESLAKKITSAASIGMAVKELVTFVLTYKLTIVIVKEVADVLGIEAAFILAILAIASGHYLDTPGLQTPNEMLDAMSASLNGMTRSKAEDIVEIRDEALALKQEMEDYKESEEYLDLQSNINWDALLVSKYGMESPNEYMYRTTQISNGLLGTQGPSTFVSQSLRLPLPTQGSRVQIGV